MKLDAGTIVADRDFAEISHRQVKLANHVHFSEPDLGPLQNRGYHGGLAAVLRDEGCGGCVSIEIRRAAGYLVEVFS